jgi:hypothetical protein
MQLLIRMLLTACLVCLSTPDARAFSRKPVCTVRFYVEVDASGADPFAVPVKVGRPPRHIFHESAASLSERQITGAQAYQTADGTWAALIKLDASGRLTLANISSGNRGRSLVVYVGNAKVSRLLQDDILIDRLVTDGFIQIRGLLVQEAYQIQKLFPPLKPEEKGTGAKP